MNLVGLTEPRSSGPTPTWECFTCRGGLFVKRSFTPPDSRIRKGGQGYYLPDPSNVDDEILKEPALALRLFDEEICEITSPHSPIAVAATFIGPPQDKTQNEDFSLTAVIRGVDGEPWAFAAVADGVSTKTFWPARAARISALAAFQTVRQAIILGFDGSDIQLEKLRNDIAKNLRRELRRDQEILQRERIHPRGWAPDLYVNFIGNSEYWYNSTLLLAFLGPQQGFALWAGDGGISILKDGQQTEALRSTDDLVVGTFVSLQVTSAHFQIARIIYPPHLGEVRVCLASDGVDRTLQRESLTYGKIRMPQDPRQAREFLHKLAQQPGREIDNYSFAWLSGPLPRTFEWKPAPQSLPKSEITGGISPKHARREALVETLHSYEPDSDTPSVLEPGGQVSSTPPPSISRRWTSLALLIVVFLLGFITASALPYLEKLRDKNFTPLEDEPGTARQEPGKTTNPSGKRGPGTTAQPVPILLGQEERDALNRRMVSEAMTSRLELWARFLEQQPVGKKYYVLVYGRREDMNDPVDCTNQINRARARAQLLTDDLVKQVDPTKQQNLDSTGQANVCTPPPDFGTLLNDNVVRAILTDQLPSCTCEQPKRVQKTNSQKDKKARKGGGK